MLASIIREGIEGQEAQLEQLDKGLSEAVEAWETIETLVAEYADDGPATFEELCAERETRNTSHPFES